MLSGAARPRRCSITSPGPTAARPDCRNEPAVGRRGLPRAGVEGSPPAASRIDIRSDLTLLVTGQASSVTPALLAGYAAQAAAALDRELPRTEAAQAEALAEGNRMRIAPLAAVSHALRTPLASIKALVSSLRQTDVDRSEPTRPTCWPRSSRTRTGSTPTSATCST